MAISTTFAKRLFYVAAIYGIVALLPQYAMETKMGVDFPPAITHPEYFYGFIGVALAWQIAFLMIARDVQRYRLFMLPAALEKIAVGGAAIVLYTQGRVPTLVLGGGILDLIFAFLFLLAFRSTRATP